MENPPSRGSPGRTAATSEVNPIRVASAAAWGKLGDVRRDPPGLVAGWLPRGDPAPLRKYT